MRGPTRRERGLFSDAVQRARRAGVSFPPGVVEVRFRRFDEGAALRGFCLVGTHPILVVVDANQSDRACIETVLHELRHAWDAWRLGAERYKQIPAAERERRARAFEDLAQ